MQNRIIVNHYAPLLKEGHLTDKSDDRVGHLKTILAQGEGILNLQKFKCQDCPGEGVLKFRVDWRIIAYRDTGNVDVSYL